MSDLFHIPNSEFSISPVWHPYTQMQDAGIIPITRGEGTYLYDDKGNQYIDAVASWWTNIHGHAHPYIANAIAEQAKKLEQVIFAGFTHEPAEILAHKLLLRIPHHQKIFYSDNGSTAVEVAIKMALQYWSNKGEARKKIICFRDAYHGDTFGSMSVSERGVFTKPFQQLLFDVEFIEFGNSEIRKFENEGIAAFIFEPLVLGSAGMKMYSAELLDELLAVCKKNNIITIADEVMTGFGRTGKFLATDYCTNKPDIICLSKGITGGFLPFAATTCTQNIYDAFLSTEKQKMFLHGHSYTANPLGCAAAIASLEVFETENIFEKITRIETQHAAFAETLKNDKRVKEVRQRGTILAIEMQTDEASGYLNNIRDHAYQFFIERKIILRPLGNVIYILPPYCISNDDLKKVYGAISDFLAELS
ncbi:MAG: adenosylmethionine--8-amino-7-oxononanoate transaminase [Bacteroidetes bacterium]|nr:adenosylmethionine--8-amino-7-oxononanoate transaminase [Bacteroidota bacterium]